MAITYQDGICRWFLNTILYVVGAGGATLPAIMGGYAGEVPLPRAQGGVRGQNGAISVPGIALAVPQFLLFAKLGLTNTPWSMRSSPASSAHLACI